MPRPGTCRSLTMCNVWWIVWVPCYRSVPCLCYDFDRLTRRGYLFACKYNGLRKRHAVLVVGGLLRAGGFPGARCAHDLQDR